MQQQENTMIKIRRARLEEIPIMMDIYDTARAFMRKTGNQKQWANGYPSAELVREDIEKGISYVAEYDKSIEAVFVYFQDRDPCYDVIVDGEWRKEGPYSVIHRIASKGNVKGIGSYCIQWGFQQYGNLKMDTHRDNRVMQHVLLKNGFERCGIVFMQDGTERIAFQKYKDELL